MTITLRHLRYFEALSRHRHFSRAAEECSVTQPALSVRVQELEASLGVALLERRRGALGMTRIGEEVAQRAAAILLSVRDLRDYAISAAGALTGPLALGIIPTVAPYILGRLLPALNEAFPKLELRISEAQTSKLQEETASGNLDVILISTAEKTEGLTQMPLFDDGFLLATGTKSHLARLKSITQESLAAADLLLLDEGHCLRDQSLSFCRIAPRQTREKYGAASLGTLLQLIAHGQGATFLPEIAVPVEMRGDWPVTLRHFTGPKPYRTLGLAWRETSPRGEDFRTLGNVIAETGKAIVAEGREIAGRG